AGQILRELDDGFEVPVVQRSDFYGVVRIAMLSSGVTKTGHAEDHAAFSTWDLQRDLTTITNRFSTDLLDARCFVRRRHLRAGIDDRFRCVGQREVLGFALGLLAGRGEASGFEALLMHVI